MFCLSFFISCVGRSVFGLNWHTQFHEGFGQQFLVNQVKLWDELKIKIWQIVESLTVRLNWNVSLFFKQRVLLLKNVAFYHHLSTCTPLVFGFFEKK